VRSVDLHWGSACCTFPDRAPQRHRTALATIAAAMRAHPELVGSSTGRVDTELMRTNGTLVAKSGAEGYFCVGHADGLVVAIRRAGWISDADLNGALRAFGPRVPIFNLAGRYTGEVRPTDSWGIPTTQDNSLTAVAVSCADPTRRRGHRVKAPADRAVAGGRPLKVGLFLPLAETMAHGTAPRWADLVPNTPGGPARKLARGEGVER
jgi:hypothetical protein